MGWYPGHMKKALDEIKNKLSIVDVVIELIDARIPNATKNPLIDSISENKIHLILLNKTDLADDEETKKWVTYFKEKYDYAIPINAKQNKDIIKVMKVLENIRKELEETKNRVDNFELKAMVVGMPNVGKSTFLNALKGKKSAKVGNLPGITRNQQWMRVNDKTLLLDTPGILMTNREDEMKLNLLKILNLMESQVDDSDLAFDALKLIKNAYPEKLRDRFQIEINDDILDIFNQIGKRRGTIISGGEIDYTRAGGIILNELRNGQIGKMTFEKV